MAAFRKGNRLKSLQGLRHLHRHLPQRSLRQRSSGETHHGTGRKLHLLQAMLAALPRFRH